MKWMGNYFNVSLSNSSMLSISPTFYARFFRTKVLHPGDRRDGCQFHQHSKSCFCADILAPWAQNLQKFGEIDTIPSLPTFSTGSQKCKTKYFHSLSLNFAKCTFFFKLLFRVIVIVVEKSFNESTSKL
jgi:hypothetical protein